MGVGVGARKGGERREKGKTRKSLGEWEGGDGGRVDIGAGKKISTLKET